MENSTTSMEYCTIFLQNNIPQNSHALSISVVHIMQHLSSLPEFGISDSRFSCYVGVPTDAYYIYPPNNMDGKMQNCKIQIKFTL